MKISLGDILRYTTISVVIFAAFVASHTVYAANPTGYFGWMSRVTTEFGVDSSCGASMIREEFIFRDIATNATTSDVSVTLRKFNLDTSTTIDGSSTTSIGSKAGPICYNPDTEGIQIIVNGGTAYYNFVSTNSWQNPGTLTRDRYVQSTVWLRATPAGQVDYQHSYPVNVATTSDPSYKVLLNYLPGYDSATALSGASLFVVEYDVETSSFGSTLKSISYELSGGIGTKTIPPQGITEGYRTWAYYLRANGSHNTPSYGALQVPVTGFSNFNWPFLYDRTSPIINGITHSHSNPPSNPYPSDAVILTASATDSLAGVSNMKIYFDQTLHTSCSFANSSSAECNANIGSFVASSTHEYFVVAVDGLGNTSTSSTQSFTVVNPMPDLSISSVNIPSVGSTITPTTFSATVQNTGNGSTSISFINVFQKAYSVDGDNTVTIGTTTLSALGSSTEMTAINDTVFEYTFSADDAGTTRYIRVCADLNDGAYGEIEESNELNNCSTWEPVSVATVTYNPITLTSDTGSCGVIAFSWNDVVPDGITMDDLKYYLTQNGNEIYSGTSTFFTYTATPDTERDYRVTLQRNGSVLTESNNLTEIAPSGECNYADITATALSPDDNLVFSNRYPIDFEGVVSNVSLVDVEEAGYADLEIDWDSNSFAPDTTFNAYGGTKVGPLGQGETKQLSYSLLNPQSGNHRYRFHVDTRNELVGSNSNNDVTEWVSFRVIEGSVTASPTVVNSGTTSLISWSTENAGGLACSVSGDVVTMTGESGSASSSALFAQSTTFTLSCLEPSLGTPLPLDFVTVYSGNPPELSIRPRVAILSENVTISWNTHNGDEQSCTLRSSPSAPDLITENAGDPSTGSIELPVTSRMTYIITCPSASDTLYDIETVEIVPQGFEL